MTTPKTPAANTLSTHSLEFAWIEAIAQREAASGIAPAGTVGIGDDAAYIPTDSLGVLIATDTLLEGVHFDATAQPEQIGHKAVAVNLSDIAAMAGQPVAATVAISVPRSVGLSTLNRIMIGLQETAHRFGVSVVGGDTTAWDGPLAITVTVIATPGPNGVITRSGAAAGDALYVTGPLGRSIAGHHLTFEPRVAEALLITSTHNVSAMIDLSDGLASDARHLATASRCGVLLEADSIPLRQPLTGSTGLDHALSDGEDFELLIAIRGQHVPPSGMIRIGELIEPQGVFIIRDGEQMPLAAEGYSHAIGRNGLRSEPQR